MLTLSDTIVAIATPPGEGAIGIIRLSGAQAITIANAIFRGKDLTQQPSHTIHFGRIHSNGTVIDEVVISIYKGPRSYTGEDIIEISCHGSNYILQQVLELCIRQGARMAKPGEFTLRAFLSGKLDLAQAEAVADLIASQNSSAHKAAMHNLKGGFSADLADMRDQLIQFSALIELELDFSEEDVEFADRTRFYQLIERLTHATAKLLESFKLGNAIKNGVSVAIVGRPNAGKSTLLNALLNEERAIVSDIAGTTRDTIEETLNINGITFRLIDTAGIREHTGDVIEQQGIERSRRAMSRADVVVYLFDVANNSPQDILQEIATVQAQYPDAQLLWVANKADQTAPDVRLQYAHLQPEPIFIAAKNNQNINALKNALYALVAEGEIDLEGTIVTNARHYGALQEVLNALHDIRTGLDRRISGDLIALDIRRCLHYLGDITGQVTTEDKLDYIFSKFCIGK